MKPNKFLVIALSVSLTGEQLIPKADPKAHIHRELIETIRLRPQMQTTLTAASGETLLIFTWVALCTGNDGFSGEDRGSEVDLSI